MLKQFAKKNSEEMQLSEHSGSYLMAKTHRAVIEIFEKGLADDQERKREIMQKQGFVDTSQITDEIRMNSMGVELRTPKGDDSESEAVECIQFLVISEDSPLLMVFKPINVIACLISSYIYMWFAAFGDDGRTKLQIVLEAQFFLDIITNFLTQY